MGIIKIEIDRFRALKNISFNIGNKLTAIAGKNGTLKTTTLGIIGQPFSLQNSDIPMYGEETIDGYNFKSQFSEKFKLSTDKDKPGEHLWRLYLTPDIYSNDSGIFELESIYRDKGKKQIRFWSTKGKDKGTGYLQYPVVFLSLKRLYPIGENKTVELNDYNLSLEEKEILIKWYKEIFTDINRNDFDIKKIKTSSKNSTSISTNEIDPITISAGQDNIGKILLTILSFKRLKDKYPFDYQGGLILIDELEATLHSSALRKLLKILIKSAGDYKLQIIFTTHSEDIVIKELLSAKYSNDNTILYFKKVDDEVKVYENELSLDQIKSDLGSEIINSDDTKIRIYTEDDVGMRIVKCLLPNDKKKKFDFINLNLGEGEYKNLLDHKCKDFLNSIIIVDGDQWNNKSLLKHKNVITLPGKHLPEKFLYDFLYNLPENDEYWNTKPGGYDKPICFYNHPNAHCKEQYKEWFTQQQQHFGKGLSRLMNRWKKSNPELHNKFIRDFEICERSKL